MTSAATTDQADGTLDVRVLGEFAVLRNGEPVALPPSRKTRALLAYLAVVGRPQSRERLCRLLWDVPDDPRAALRWSLSKIRQIVNVDGSEPLVTDRNTVTLRGPSIVLDLQRVKAISPRDLQALDLDELEGAARLFKGAFLEDLALARCPEFEAWRAAQVSDLDLLKASILRALIDRLADAPARALPHAHALRAMHPDNEALAAELRALTERARGHAMSSPPPAPADAIAAPTRDPAPVTAERALRLLDEVRQLIAVDRQSAAPAAADDGERRQVTMLAIEIVSALHAFASADPELVAHALDPLLETAVAVVERHGGIVSASGDSGVTAVFGASPASAQHAAAACRAALAVKSEVEQQSQASVRVRAGLDTGDVVIRRRRRAMGDRIEVAGAPVRTAARLARSLRRAVLAVTDSTRLAAAGVMETEPLPRSDLPRFERDARAHALLGEQS